MKPKINISNGFTSKEIELISRLEYERKEVYTKENIFSFFGDKYNTDYLISRLLIKKRLRPIVKNVYLFIPMKAPRGIWSGNEYIIAKALSRGAKYYIGYSAVFNSYGFTDQVSQMIHIVNEKYSLMKKFEGIKYKLIKVLPNRLYGLDKRIINNEEIFFSSRERSLIDVFEFYNVKQAFMILSEQMKKVNLVSLTNSIVKYPVQIIRRRIGYFLDKLKVDQKLLKKIDVGIKGYSYLYDSNEKKGKVNKRWRLIING